MTGFGWAVVATVAAVAGVLVVVSSGLGSDADQDLGDLGQLTAAVLAALACLRAARRSGPDARGWGLLAVSVGIWVAAAAIWAVRGLTYDHVYPFPSVADIGFLGYSVPAVVALLLLRRRAVGLVTRLRGVLDGLVIATSILFISWALVLGPAYHSGPEGGLAWATGLAYPLVDAVVASLVLALAMRQSPGARLPWALLASGLLTLTATDSVFVSLTLRGEVGLTGTVLCAGWVAAFLLVALGALAPAQRATLRPARNLTVAQELLPYLPVAIAFIVAARQPVFREPFLLWDGATVLALVAGRQVLLIMEKVALTGDLEAKVQLRTAEVRSAREDLQETFENAPIGMVWADLNGIFLQVNAAFCRMVGRGPDELLGTPAQGISYPEDAAETVQRLSEAASTARIAPFEKRYRHSDGSEVWGEVSLSTVRDASGNPRFYLAQIQDITERRSSAARAKANEAAFHNAVLENLSSGVTACDAAGNLTLFNRASREQLGPLVEALRPDSWAEHYGLYRSDGVTPLPMEELPLVRALSGEHVHNAEFVIAHEDAAPRMMVANGQSISDADGVLLGAVMATQDITGRRTAETALKRQALHDPLTGLANRTLLRDRLEHAIARQTHHAHPLSLLLLDLDGFKLVNDSLGHRAGDEVLVTLAARLKATLRPHDTIARLGGDEFAVVLENTSEAEATAIAGNILAVIRRPIDVHGRSITSDASGGIMVSTGVSSPETLLRNADLAMYAAKDGGGGAIKVFSASMHETVLERLTLEAELRTALDGRQFTLVYQPIVSLITEDLQGFEALARWNHPDRGVISPMTFIPLAETTGLIVPLGRWVLREACRQASKWRRTHPGTEALIMSVNVSVRQLQDPEILDVVAAALSDAGLPAEQLQLEITESVLDHQAQAVDVLKRLHASGVRLAIDDFGTGYSSLSRLHALPLDKVKIDKSFIDHLAGGAAAPMVAATIALAHSLGLQTVAEGVETSDQLPFLRVHNCDEAQGYLFSRPIAATAVSAMLSRRGTGASWTSGDTSAPDRGERT